MRKTQACREEGRGCSSEMCAHTRETVEQRWRSQYNKGPRNTRTRRNGESGLRFGLSAGSLSVCLHESCNDVHFHYTWVVSTVHTNNPQTYVKKRLLNNLILKFTFASLAFTSTNENWNWEHRHLPPITKHTLLITLSILIAWNQFVFVFLHKYLPSHTGNSASMFIYRNRAWLMIISSKCEMHMIY